MTRQAPVLLACLLVVSAALPVLAQPESSYTFQTVLLIGSVDGKPDLRGVPANVTAALDDVTQFLPYKNYRMLDASILRSNGSARGRATGGDGREFELEFEFEPGGEDTLVVRRFSIEALLMQPRERMVTENGKTEDGPLSWVRKKVIGTSFTLKVGETIVVGSSKLDGSGEALVVLFTAMR